MGMYTKWGVNAELKPGADLDALKKTMHDLDRGEFLLEAISIIGPYMNGHGEMKNYMGELQALNAWLSHNAIITGKPCLVTWYEEDDMPTLYPEPF
jgi:hypothetical protein